MLNFYLIWLFQIFILLSVIKRTTIFIGFNKIAAEVDLYFKSIISFL